MFRIKNASDNFQTLSVLHGGKPLVLGLDVNAVSGSINEHFRSYFQQNEVEWAIVLPDTKEEEVVAIETVEIQSIGKPVIELSREKRKYTKRG